MVLQLLLLLALGAAGFAIACSPDGEDEIRALEQRVAELEAQAQRSEVVPDSSLPKEDDSGWPPPNLDPSSWAVAVMDQVLDATRVVVRYESGVRQTLRLNGVSVTDVPEPIREAAKLLLPSLPASAGRVYVEDEGDGSTVWLWIDDPSGTDPGYILVNRLLIASGLALADEAAADGAYFTYLIQAEDMARAGSRGLWAERQGPRAADGPTFEPRPQTQVPDVSSLTAAVVIEVLDGDTIQVMLPDGTRARVRYLGIDAPERSEPGGPAASQMNDFLVGDATVFLERDQSETDQFGRLLRYAYVISGDRVVFVNEYLVRQGLARATAFAPDLRYEQVFDWAEERAQLEGAGIWSR